MKTFPIKTAEGVTKNVPQLATFTQYIQGVQFRFVVTQETPTAAPAVTHRHSGMRVVAVLLNEQMASKGHLMLAGKMALARLIRDHGEARVRSVLAASEAPKSAA